MEYDMGWGPRRQMNYGWIAGLMILLVVILAVTEGNVPWPLFFFFFWFGRPLLWGGRRETEQEHWREAEKRKNDETLDEKAKNDASDGPTRYLLTDDGEVMEIVDDPALNEKRRHLTL